MLRVSTPYYVRTPLSEIRALEQELAVLSSKKEKSETALNSSANPYVEVSAQLAKQKELELSKKANTRDLKRRK